VSDLPLIAGGRYQPELLLLGGDHVSTWRVLDQRRDLHRWLTILDPGAPATMRRRFEDAARDQARLQHRHVVTTCDLGSDGERPWILTAPIEGETLAAAVARAPLPRARALEVLAACLAALGAAHQKGVLHRGLTPAVVHLTPRGAPLLSGFGFALSPPADPLEGRAWIAPEQRAGVAGADARADLYSAGALLAFALTGQRPVDLWSSGVAEGLLAALDPPLVALIRQACAYEPHRRFADADEMRAALEALGDAPSRAPALPALDPDALVAVSPRPPPRWRWLAVAAALAALAALAATRGL